MSDRIFTRNEVLESLERIVERVGPDHRYQDTPGIDESNDDSECAYSTPDGAPACIVGYVLADLAPEVFATIHENERYLDEDEYGTERVKLRAQQFDFDMSKLGVPEVPFDAEAMDALKTAQRSQDYGTNWGGALNAVKFEQSR